MYFHTLLLQSPSRLPPVEQRPNCLVNEVLDGLRLSVIAQIRHWDWGHRLGSKWPTSNTIWPRSSSACAQPWRQLHPPCFVWNKLTPDLNRAETDTRHVWGNEAWQHHRVNHASVYQGISQINWTLWQFANNNETETWTQQQQAKCWQKLLNYFSFKYFMMADSQIFLGVLCVVIIETFLTWLLMIDRDCLV